MNASIVVGSTELFDMTHPWMSSEKKSMADLKYVSSQAGVRPLVLDKLTLRMCSSAMYEMASLNSDKSEDMQAIFSSAIGLAAQVSMMTWFDIVLHCSAQF
jgi:hypothetical protein